LGEKPYITDVREANFRGKYGLFVGQADDKGRPDGLARIISSDNSVYDG